MNKTLVLLKENPENYEPIVYSTEGNTWLWLSGDEFDAPGIHSATLKVVSYAGRGILYSRLEYYEEAVADLSKAIALNEVVFLLDKAGIYYQRGIAYFGLAQYESGLADFHAAIVHGVSHLDVYWYRALSYIQLNELDNAIADLNRLVESEPDIKRSALYQFRRGLTFRKLGEENKALADIKNAIELDHNLISFLPVQDVDNP